MDKIKVAPIKAMVKYGDLEKIDVRVGMIESVEDIEESDKLVKLVVNFGDHKRSVVNLEPREMMGVLSEGMLFDIGYPDKITPVLAVPEKPVPNGTRAG